MPQAPGKPAFGRYKNLVLLGSGGMGAVYRATDPTLDRRVAIKVLTHPDPKYVERFRRQAQALANRAHPACIKISDIVGDESDAAAAYIVMEHVDGKPLAVLLKRGRLPPAQVVSILRQCADGLRRAHAVNVVHRDIKPGNLMMSPSG